jgi:hypothetical protein
LAPLVGRTFTTKDKVELDVETQISRFKLVKNRPVVGVSLGPRYIYRALPHSNPGCSLTSALGALYRVGRAIPPGQYQKHSKPLRKFVDSWLNECVEPLAADTNFDSDAFEAWLEGCTYSQSRKKQLRDVYYKSNFSWQYLSDLVSQTGSIKKAIKKMISKMIELNSFIKDEHYVDWKHSRSINSRKDLLKCILGPICQLMADAIMKQRPEFIKYVPVHLRAKYIYDRLFKAATKAVSSDYTSFESHFRPSVMQDVEMRLFRHMLKNVPFRDLILEFIAHFKYKALNVMNFKHFTMKVRAKRMSGEMDTSLSNGFSNLMFLYYTAHANGMDWRDVKCVIEGDDALCVMTKTVPQQFFKDLGLLVKVDVQDSIEHASFCGLIFDLDDMAVVSDIVKNVVSFGWTNHLYLAASEKKLTKILRCKAFSMAYQYKHCPILSKLAQKYLDLTSHVNIDNFSKNNRFNDNYKQEILLQALEYYKSNDLIPSVGMGTRNLVEKVYGITIADQYRIEQEIDNIKDLSPMHLPSLDKYIPRVFNEYDDKYRIKRRVNDNNALDLIFAHKSKQTLGAVWQA